MRAVVVLPTPRTPGEHPGLRDAAGLEGVRQGADHRLLADQVLEGARAVFAGQNPVGRAGSRARLKRKARQGRLVVQGRAGCGFVHRLQSFGIQHGAESAGVGGWTKTRSVSLGLLPSGPDPVGE